MNNCLYRHGDRKPIFDSFRLNAMPNVWRILLGSLLISLLIAGCSKKEEDLSSQSKAEKLIQEHADTIQDIAFQKFKNKVPIYQYYQKISKMSGVTNDTENLIFNLQIELGYEVGDVKTLEKLSRFGYKISGEVRQSVAAKSKTYLSDLNNYPEIEKDILELVNKIIAPDSRDKARAKDVIIAELFLYDYR
ncbi:hypothetical protein P0082_08460 [Candidatus Haliotispira prima]|uniref:Uncharacterized protein n=1 Tax=Candidatus Haliotispira prima TaxID=3034016 RepID=A0ABY8MEW3_9SPIO|nr:hypothetical protein P0082_08460 [Candidatus Haliotispira prima]